MAAGTSKRLLVMMTRPKLIADMTDEELDDFCVEFVDTMFERYEAEKQADTPQAEDPGQ